MNALQKFIQSKQPQGGFLSETELAELAKLSRLTLVLVRCGGCRFLAAAQYVTHLIRCIEAGGDYVRDVSFPDGAMESAADWTPEIMPKELQGLSVF
jgi:hypothetical protein